ncbi:putative lipoprotein [Streptococcus pneumoniae]|uniref:Putative lipoprotein n=1 Tax=Streptococcus pneumoniae TaxID=1313 RepID=A0A4J1W009_STREE|nr:putative lipoprotein [Streptococcus pneumoniae]VIW01492.1 putative lipoprotein [Streptococcus pneumoniae]VNP62380.1 putative lipoprotein [Streptococcus pneumoniae]
MKQKQPIVSRTKQHTFEELIQDQKLERLAKLSPDLVGRYGFTASCASSFANLIKEAYGGKNLNVVYASRMLALWNIACSCYHKADGYSLADALFSDKKICLDSYYYHKNTSNTITSDVIKDVYDNYNNYMVLTREATPEYIYVVQTEMPKDSDLYFYIREVLGLSFSTMHYAFLVKVLAGAFARKYKPYRN